MERALKLLTTMARLLFTMRLGTADLRWWSFWYRIILI